MKPEEKAYFGVVIFGVLHAWKVTRIEIQDGGCCLFWVCECGAESNGYWAPWRKPNMIRNYFKHWRNWKVREVRASQMNRI